MRGGMADPAHNDRLKKLRFRAWRRGFRELDLIMGPFAAGHLEDLDPTELDDFEALLDQSDHDVYAWINGKAAPPAAFRTSVLDRLRVFHRNLPIAGGDPSGV